MTDVVTVLRDARALLARPGGWCKHTMEKPAFGRPYDSFCVLGAVLEAGQGPLHEAEALLLPLFPPSDPDADPITDFNDAPSTRKRDVLNLIDRAIAQAEAGS